MKPEINLTEKEKTVLKAVVESEYNDFPYTNPVWLEIVSDDTFKGKAFSGICASLQEKGLIRTYLTNERINGDPKGMKESTIEITQTGLDLIKPFLNKQIQGYLNE
jgi:hypothetical protein